MQKKGSKGINSLNSSGISPGRVVHNSKSSAVLPYRSSNLSSKNIKKNVYKSRENSIDNSKSFLNFQRNFNQRDAKGTKRSQDSASKVFAEISNKGLLTQLDCMKKPVTKKALQIVKCKAETLDIKEGQNQLKYQYAPYNYMERIRNCQSEGKLIKKYNYLGQQRSCLREHEYLSTGQNPDYKWKRSKSTRGYLLPQTRNFKYNIQKNPESFIRSKIHEPLKSEIEFNINKNLKVGQKSPYLAIKQNSIDTKMSKWRQNHKYSENKYNGDKSIRGIVTSEFDSQLLTLIKGTLTQIVFNQIEIETDFEPSL